MEAAPTPAVKAAHIPKAKAHHTSVAAFAAGTIAVAPGLCNPNLGLLQAIAPDQLIQHLQAIAPAVAPTVAPAAKAAPTPALAEATQLLQQLQAIAPAVAPTENPAAKAAPTPAKATPTPAKAAQPVALSPEGLDLMDRANHQRRQQLCLSRMEICVNRLKLAMAVTPSRFNHMCGAANLNLMFSIYADLQENHAEYVGGSESE